MSLGKALLLVLVLVGNAAFLLTRWGERTGRLPPLYKKALRPPLSPLPKRLMWSLFAAFAVFFAAAVVYEACKFSWDHTLPRLRVARADDDPTETYDTYERVGRDGLLAEAQAEADKSNNPLLIKLAQREADLRRAKMIEARIGEFIVAFLSLGVFAFLLGDNRFYRFIEAIIMGGTLAYLLAQIDTIIRPDWYEPIKYGLTGQALDQRAVAAVAGARRAMVLRLLPQVPLAQSAHRGRVHRAGDRARVQESGQSPDPAGSRHRAADLALGDRPADRAERVPGFAP